MQIETLSIAGSIVRETIPSAIKRFLLSEISKNISKRKSVEQCSSDPVKV